MAAHDVVIVGAGPAGGYLAYLLASRGISVALLEKEELPRYKVCGGGVTMKAVRLLEFDLGSVVEGTPRIGVVTMRQKKTLEVPIENPIAWTVMRDRFDAAIVERAVARGATLYERRRVRDVNGQVVRADGEVFRGEIVVGADGVLSQVASSSGLCSDRRLAAAIECEVVPEPAVFARFADRAVFDFGASPYGYGWVFPKREHLSLGVCTIVGKARSLGRYADRLLQTYCPKGAVLRRRGHLLPVFTAPRPVSADRTILLGDAAGLVDPFTGEGIYYALKSATLAADAIQEFLGGDPGALRRYDKSVWDTLGPNLAMARRISRVVFGHQQRLYDLILRNRFFAIGFIDVLTGQTSYSRFISSSLRSPLKIAAGYLRR